jgi:hypothetical protein
MTQQAITRFDIDNLNTNATRALAEAEPSLRASIAKRQESARAVALAMTVADLRERVGGSVKSGKAELVEAYAQKIANGSPSSKELDQRIMEANMDGNLAYTLNRMMKQGDDARAAMERLHEEHPQDRMRKLRTHLIALHVGEIADRVLRDAVDYGTDLRDAVQHEFVTAVRALLRYADTHLEGTSCFLSEEQVAAANIFRRDLGGVMPPMDVPARRLI